MILDLFGAPWLITEGALKTIIAIASRDRFFADARKDALEARAGAPLKNSRTMTVRGSTAIIPVVGPLIRHADMFSDVSGVTSYAALRKDLQVALDSSEVDSILFSIDSPGGEANGCFELADAIYEARKVKPVRAYVGGMGASAAYALACACEDITIAASAEVGSIGVRAGYMDDSAALESAGLKEWTFVSSQSPYKAFDVNVEDDRARLQVVIDDLAGVFVAMVARNRDVSPAMVLEKFGKGDVMVGARGVAAGLADQLGSFEGLLSEMNQLTGQPDAMRCAAMEKRMTTKAKVAEVEAPKVAASMSNAKCDGCGTPMSGNCYCQTCLEADDDEDEDDDEDATALGVDKAMSRADRRARMSALVEVEKHALELTGAKTWAEAKGKIAAASAAGAELAELRAKLETAESASMATTLRAALEAGIASKTLNTGMILTRLPTVLRGETKKAFVAATAKVKEVKPASVIAAACSVKISADDLEALTEFVKGCNSPVAADAFEEPGRDPEAESAELNETAEAVKKAAAAAHKTLDRGMRAATKK